MALANRRTGRLIQPNAIPNKNACTVLYNIMRELKRQIEEDDAKTDWIGVVNILRAMQVIPHELEAAELLFAELAELASTGETLPD